MNTASETPDPIHEVNLLYLHLAQRLLREDRASAVFRLGIAEHVASVLENLSPTQISRLAASTQVLCRFRFDDHAVLSSLGSHDKVAPDTHSQMAMPLDAQPVG